jgi:hypothetical protein
MPGVTRVGFDPISLRPLQLRRRGHHTLDLRIYQVASQTKAGRASLIDHHRRARAATGSSHKPLRGSASAAC